MAFPLQDVTVPELKELCQAIWDWKLCENCQEYIGGRSSPSRRCLGADDCPWGQRSERLGPFFDFYREVTGSYVPDFFGEEDQALRGHRDLFDIIRLTRRCGFTLPRALCVREHFATRFGDVDRQTMVPESDQDRAFNLAARVLTMTNFDGADNQDFFLDRMRNGDEGGIGAPPPAVWASTKCLQDTMAEIFPPRIHPSLQVGDPQSTAIKNSLTAEMLKRVARIRIERTDDLRDHLRLDSAMGVVQVFHLTSVLREHLLATKSRGGDEALPRELALETLYTLQLLFPPGGTSQAMLRTLVSKQGFDPDSLRFGTALFELSPHERERALCFPVWGTRLMDLYDEVENPKPRGKLDVWLERRSKSRHIMLATAVGIFTAVLLGLLSLCPAKFCGPVRRFSS
ncbi:hypothetical protein CHGG_03497 [Chaetomium globosum CBS 148.51]|uniref:Uncharacterized protein n=1 Tax=Chaetomium globosum (strain ATCC 6205 / CBS 148.51 / DSM 1962 / NBRC 6347 / NRRL 1970) TaxID=306901 RepID=Q2H8F7_CHAGB|nr:uncharacterized protein CHGG_03497 [Chaetomium globosum CBS 148.51]EAQ91562.1 hypothetical protein CHGG_03497 [Chaetomium globosum CBS 148.51]